MVVWAACDWKTPHGQRSHSEGRSYLDVVCGWPWLLVRYGRRGLNPMIHSIEGRSGESTACEMTVDHGARKRAAAGRRED